MTIGSLFSGIGGLEMGLEICGVGPVVWQAESDPYARAVLVKNWAAVHRYKDVREIDEATARVDVVCGGFPCQDISDDGHRAGINGQRSGLWGEFRRIIEILAPSTVFIENVAALAHRGLDQVLRDLAALGFDAEWGTIGACAVGAPHRRRRMFILAHTDRARRASWWGVGASKEARRSAWNLSERRRAWPREPDMARVAYGIPGGSHRRRLLGNAVVPAQAALAWQMLSARIAV